jgi:hypothetical protein
MELTTTKAKELKSRMKKVWNKPKLYSGKGIGFLGLGHVQTSTGPYGTPS